MAGRVGLHVAALSTVALIAGQGPLAAQTVLWGDAQPNPAPVYTDPNTPVYTDPNFPVYTDQPVTQYPEPSAPVYTTPAPQTGTVYAPADPVYTQPAAPAQPQRRRGGRTAEMVKELSDLIEVGERYRAASPGFLEDLKALREKYSRVPVGAPLEATQQPQVTVVPPEPTYQTPAQPTHQTPTQPTYQTPIATVNPAPQPAPQSQSTNVFLQDAFADGDYTLNPTWSPRQGEWRIDPQFGLRAVTAQTQAQAPLGPQDLLQVLLGGQAPQRETASGAPEAHLIEAAVPIGNAFSMAAEITAHQSRGAVHFIMHQAGSSWPGYRLELRSGAEPLVVLTRRGASGYKDIMKVSAPGYSTGQSHELRWARLSDGQMFVILNGEPLITARDNVFQQDWTGFALFNAGGDVSVRNIRIASPIER